MISFLSKLYQIVLYIDVDTPGNGKYVAYCFNAIHKRYLAIFLRMRSTPEVDKIDSKCMCVDAMTEKGESSFAKDVSVYRIFVMKLVPMVIRKMRNTKLNHT